MDGSLATVVSVVLAVAGLLGAAWAVFQGSAKSKTLELYESELDLRKEQAVRLEEEKKRLEKRVDNAIADAARWQESVTQKADVEKLTLEIRREEAARREFEKVMQTLLLDVLAQMKNRRDPGTGGAIGTIQ